MSILKSFVTVAYASLTFSALAGSTATFQGEGVAFQKINENGSSTINVTESQCGEFEFSASTVKVENAPQGSSVFADSAQDCTVAFSYSKSTEGVFGTIQGVGANACECSDGALLNLSAIRTAYDISADAGDKPSPTGSVG